MPKIDCICCGTFYPSDELDADGICDPCNLDDIIEDDNLYGFPDDDFVEEDFIDESDDWEGDDWEDEDGDDTW